MVRLLKTPSLSVCVQRPYGLHFHQPSLALWFNFFVKIHFWKLVLTCLILITIPLRGVAGVAAAVCDTRHHSLYQSIQAVSVLDASDAGSHAGEHHHSTHDATDAEHQGHQSGIDSTHHKCSACGSCCVGTAMASGPLVFAVSFAGETVFPEPFTRHISPVLNGLDRPPQFSPA